ncbi:MAG: hypothetical protein DWQ48_09750 [Bacteroidetes bacterium]|nr:MAG: hypothetical protein DWQ48_09750 [Bacteroidota bacterium]
MQIHGEDTAEMFEFDKVLERLEQNCRFPSSKQLAKNLMPESYRDRLRIMLLQTDEYCRNLRAGAYFPDFLTEDFEQEALMLAKEGSTLTELQFANIRSASESSNNLLKYLNTHALAFPNLLLASGEIYLTDEIIVLISNIIDAQAQVKDNASRELAEIRSDLNHKRREADKKFRSFILELKKKGWLRDNEENFYNNRRVLSVPSEYRREVSGILHGKSDSGKTSFVEPEAMVELNNQIAELEQMERMEVMRLLRELTGNLRPFSKLILQYHSFLTEMDFIRAKAIFATELNAHLPQLEKNSVIELHDALHPLLFLKNKTLSKITVPLDIRIDQEHRIVIISGPNAGGKSITLKTVGLLQIMLQSGLLIPAKESSRMCFFNHFMADIGDSQSIENELSTYSSRLVKMNHFIRTANNRTLILIDEFGTGTDPELGGAIAETVLEELNIKKCFGVFTTHYTNIKLMAESLPGVQNASVLFDLDTLSPKYKLIQGQPGASYTFEVAERIGTPAHILQKARAKVQRDKLKLNTMLAGLHKQKNIQDLQHRDLQLQKEKTKQAEEKYLRLAGKLESKMAQEAEKREELRRFADLGRKMNSLIEEWEKTKDRKEVIRKFVGSLTAQIKKKAAENTPGKVARRREKLIEKLKAEIREGSLVRMLKGKQVGIVEEIRKNDVVVIFGNLRVTATFENLEPVHNQEEDVSGKK